LKASGHWLRLGLDASVANHPKETCDTIAFGIKTILFLFRASQLESRDQAPTMRGKNVTLSFAIAS